MAKVIKKHLKPTWSIVLSEPEDPTCWNTIPICYEARVNEELYSHGIVNYIEIRYVEPPYRNRWANALSVDINNCDFKCDLLEIDFRYLHEYFIRITQDTPQNIGKAMLWLNKHVLNQQKSQANTIESLSRAFNIMRKCNEIETYNKQT